MVVLAAGCRQPSSTPGSQQAANVADPTATSAGEPPSTAGPATSDEPGSATAPQPVTWESCHDGIVECGLLTVPLDHDDPAGVTIDIALARSPATGDPDEVIGTIFVNPGGPGGSGVDYVVDGFRFTPDIAARYHLVGFDPRGVGASAPIGCSLDRTIGPLVDHSPDSAEEVTALDATSAELARSCARAEHGDGTRPGPGPGLLANVGTEAVARDLDLLRQAVGDDRLHYYGFSYGTLIGLVYADLFPARVGHLGLDGVVDPRLTLDQLLDQQAGAFEIAFEVMDNACGDDLTCPAGGVAPAHDRLAARLEAEGPTGEFGQTEAEMAALVSLYNDALWPTYADALDRAQRGDVSGLERLSDLFLGSISFTAYAAVFCTDSPRPEAAAGWEEFAERMAADHPRFGAVIANELRICAHWPVGPGPTRDTVTATGAAPALVIGNTNDPATPLINATEVAAGLDRAGLIVLDSNGHTAYRVSGCVRDRVSAYFLDDEVPTDTVRC